MTNPDLLVSTPDNESKEFSSTQLWLVAALILGFVFFPTLIACTLAMLR